MQCGQRIALGQAEASDDQAEGQASKPACWPSSCARIALQLAVAEEDEGLARNGDHVRVGGERVHVPLLLGTRRRPALRKMSAHAGLPCG